MRSWLFRMHILTALLCLLAMSFGYWMSPILVVSNGSYVSLEDQTIDICIVASRHRPQHIWTAPGIYGGWMKTATNPWNTIPTRYLVWGDASDNKQFFPSGVSLVPLYHFRLSLGWITCALVS